MKKKVFSLMMTLLLAFIGVAKADVVTIGEGTGTTYYFPIDNYFNYSCTQQIYTADEIGTAGTINAVSFYYNYGTAYTASNVTMYMKNVSRSTFSSTTDCEALSLGDIVWTGSIAPTAAGWYTFTLDTPFEYNGTDNLLVAFFDLPSLMAPVAIRERATHGVRPRRPTRPTWPCATTATAPAPIRTT